MNSVPTDTLPQEAAAASSVVDVVHLVLTLNIGGLEKFVYDLVRYADREKYSMRVLCLDEIGALGTLFDDLGVPVENLAVHHKGTLRSMLRLARRLRELRPDVLHTHNPAAHIVGAPAARLAGIRAIVHTRHGSHVVSSRKSILANRFASWCTHCLVPISTESANVARAADGVSERKLEIIRNGIDLEPYPPRERSTRKAVRKAIHVARIAFPTKDQTTLLRALRIVVNQEPDFVLDIVGDGPDRKQLEAVCDELQLRQNVNFLGYRRDVHDLLPQADLFVLSSVTEGISISLLEAMAAGLPIVATAVGGNPDVVMDGQTGLLVPERSPEALAQAMLALVRDPERAAGMGVAGRRRVENEFDMRQCAARYEQLYHSLLNGIQREHT